LRFVFLLIFCDIAGISGQKIPMRLSWKKMNNGVEPKIAVDLPAVCFNLWELWELRNTQSKTTINCRQTPRLGKTRPGRAVFVGRHRRFLPALLSDEAPPSP
jgi:hypothetical protein